MTYYGTQAVHSQEDVAIFACMRSWRVKIQADQDMTDQWDADRWSSPAMITGESNTKRG